MKLMSLGLLVERDAPAIWRGPIIMKMVQQFLRDVEWGRLDYFIVDLPPGTGDAQLSLVQATQVAGALIVTTPQEVAVGDALRGAKMFERVGVPVFGMVENMSGFADPETGPVFFISREMVLKISSSLNVPISSLLERSLSLGSVMEDQLKPSFCFPFSPWQCMQ